MRQEYLFTSSEYKSEIEATEFSTKVNKTVTDIESSDCWILKLSIKSESEDAAKQLDHINAKICGKYKPTVLTNECSGYFNKSLFPIINEFERKLRKLLYLASALQDDSDVHKIISNLEMKDLGAIFEALFSDSNFVKSAKEKVNQKTWCFTKEELLETIGEIEENARWDTLLGSACVKTLRGNFRKMKTYRNDVMHAHNISYSQFREAKQLFLQTNSELDIAIDDVIGIKTDNGSMISSNFNSVLAEALLMPKIKVDLSGAFSTAGVPRYRTVITPEVKQALVNLGGLTAMQNIISQMESSMNETIKQMNMYTAEGVSLCTGIQQDKDKESVREVVRSGDAIVDDRKD